MDYIIRWGLGEANLEHLTNDAAPTHSVAFYFGAALSRKTRTSKWKADTREDGPLTSREDSLRAFPVTLKIDGAAVLTREQLDRGSDLGSALGSITSHVGLIPSPVDACSEGTLETKSDMMLRLAQATDRNMPSAFKGRSDGSTNKPGLGTIMRSNDEASHLAFRPCRCSAELLQSVEAANEYGNSIKCAAYLWSAGALEL